MTIPDLINSTLEAGGAYFAWTNFFKLRADGEIRGINWIAWAWYVLWGAWEVGYIYPSLHQPLTIVFSSVRISANVAWLAVALRLKFRPA